MNKYGVFLTVLLPLCGFAEAQEVVTVETPAAAAIAEPKRILPRYPASFNYLMM